MDSTEDWTVGVGRRRGTCQKTWGPSRDLGDGGSIGHFLPGLRNRNHPNPSPMLTFLRVFPPRLPTNFVYRTHLLVPQPTGTKEYSTISSRRDPSLTLESLRRESLDSEAARSLAESLWGPRKVSGRDLHSYWGGCVYTNLCVSCVSGTGSVLYPSSTLPDPFPVPEVSRPPVCRG